jgi:hypothetical protein
MTQYLSRWNFSRERLTELQSSLLHKSEDVREKGLRLRRELESRSVEVTGQLKDASLTTLYEVGSTTLSTAAQWGEKLPVLENESRLLRDKAAALEAARQEVQRPGVALYDELNVKQILEALDGLSTYELRKLSRYEEANKNRVTILREVERRLS